MQRVWITGSEGHVGSALTEVLDCMEYRLMTTDIHEVDITNLKQVQQYMHVNRPDVVINCASLTDVAYCEEHLIYVNGRTVETGKAYERIQGTEI